VMTGVLIGADEAELARRKAAVLASFAVPDDGEAWFARHEQSWIIGTPDAARRRIAQLAALGVERVMLQDFVPRDLAMIDLLGREVVAAG
jgi:alkanesulfonate monooxygenase SsuD/methylene tetrahydromethanopterin reductase-like flavin-dependent oxidoreductase (luciferase family)